MRFKIETNTLSETTKESLEKGENAENEYLSKNNNLISSVQEPISEISKNYDGYSINDLKMIAKEKGLSEAMLRKYKDENRDGLIELIINAKEPPK